VVEQGADLQWIGAVRDEGVGEDVLQIAAALDLADDVVYEQLLLAGAEETLEKVVRVAHHRQYTGMEPEAEVTRFADRTVRGRDDRGEAEIVTIWIDRRPGALWSVGRAVNIANREQPAPRRDDEIWSGYELGDALGVANDALEADLDASDDNDDHNVQLKPFTEGELKARLERWFFDHA
jgi:hypothetical protein